MTLQSWSRSFSSDTGMVSSWVLFTIVSEYGQAYCVSVLDVCPFLMFVAQLLAFTISMIMKMRFSNIINLRK